MRLCKNYLSQVPAQIPHLRVNERVIEFIIESTKASPYVETGGILTGIDSAPLTVEVTHASPPGPNAYHSASKFLRDTNFCQAFLQEHYDNFGVDYVGEWHSHVLPLRKMSGGDFSTILGIMMDPDYDFKAFASIVAVLSNNQVELVGYVCNSHCIVPVKIEILTEATLA